VGLAFGAQGGTALTSATYAHIAMVAVGGLVIAAAFLWGRAGGTRGITTLLLFALLAFLTALSVLWSIAPELSYIEAGRTFAYLALFAAAVAATRLVPQGGPQLLEGLFIGAIVPVMYALASRVWPGSLGESEVSNRLGQPFDYWNAVGTVAAMGVPIGIWLATRRTSSPIARVVAYPGLGVCVVAIALTQSRGAALAALIGAAAWFAVVPLRLRSLPVVLLPLGAGLAVSAWALSKEPFTKAYLPISAKEAVASDFGVLVLLMILLLTLAGAAVEMVAARRAPSARMRRRIGVAAVAVACLVPLAAFTSVAFSERGIGERIDQLTSESEVSPEESGGRVFAASSSRGKYWREAFRVFDARPVEGVGAGAFAVGRLRHRTDAANTLHAHGWVPQTMADLGIIGIVVATLLFLAWTAAALSATDLLPRRWVRDPDDADAPLPRRDWDADRIALVALATVPLVFGVQSLLDWTWFIPMPMAMALVAAGFVCARAPLSDYGALQPIGRRPSTGRIVGAVAALATTALLAWAIWQPEASHRATDDALALADEGKFDEARDRTVDAEDLNPLSPSPLLVRAGVDTQAGRTGEARLILERAVLRFPGDPETWQRLAAFELGTLDAPEQALETIKGALYLDPHGARARQIFLNARARLREKTGNARPGVGD